MSDLFVNVAVIGRVPLLPGIVTVRVENPLIDCLVTHAFPDYLEDPEHGIKIDTGDCTVFTITHRNRGDLDLTSTEKVHAVFQQSLSAISEVSVRTKSADVVGHLYSFIRPIGTTDVKACLVQGSGDTLISWLNPAFTFDRTTASFMAGFLSNVVMLNGSAADRVPPITRRVMSSLDLINLGFHTESFANLFSLVDDLTQEVVKAGMTQKGVTEDEQRSLLRAIKEERLMFYLCTLAKLCGWRSLKEAKKNLYDQVVKVNAKRNKIMHEPYRLSPVEAVEGVVVLLALIDWLRTNPFGFSIPGFPRLRLAEPEFSVVPLKTNESIPNEQSKRNESPGGGA